MVGVLSALFIYDRYIQREHQLLINYPVIGRFRYLFEILREPFRQYFGDEEFYESKDKIDWVYDVAKNKKGFVSFAPNQPMQPPKFLIKHTNTVLNDDEVEDDFSVVFGERRAKPFRARSIIFRSAMSDGAISPEGTRAFVKGAYEGGFAINTGEGSLTSNFFFTHSYEESEGYLEVVRLQGIWLQIYNVIETIFNRYIAVNMVRKVLLEKDLEETYIFDFEKKIFFRPNWDAPLELFPEDVPKDMPDIIF